MHLSEPTARDFGETRGLYNLTARYNRGFIHRLQKARSPYDAQDDCNLYGVTEP